MSGGAATEEGMAGKREVDAGWPRAALFSLSDPTGAAGFAAALAGHGTRILASGGTARHLSGAGVEVTPIERWTGFEEMLGGRVKTLHPHVHAPILARRSDPADLAALQDHGLEPIDLVVVSLYPFEERAPRLDERLAVEEIDVGGVALLRGAAKNYRDVVVLHEPARYAEALAAYERGGPTLEERRAWAIATFERTASYDAAIAAELGRRAPAGAALPDVHVTAMRRVRSLRYGENPHQEAALYASPGDSSRLHAWKEGKELSYNNLLDLEAAVSLVFRFERPACVIVKHNTPCGAAEAGTLIEAWEAALASDSLSAFGGIVAFNQPLDGPTAGKVATQFIECVSAPEVRPDAMEALGGKKNLRVLALGPEDVRWPAGGTLRVVGRWALLQRDGDAPAPPWKTVTRREPTEFEWTSLRFAWEVAAAARSNAIAIAKGTMLVGLGSGQTSRVDAVDVALMKAARAKHVLAGTALASDGFLPFADNVEHAAGAGITAIVQPGGSVRDAEVIAACDRHGVAMVFTDRRTFRH